VSAGDNHEIQLPNDAITLYAFVLDDNSGGVFFRYFQQPNETEIILAE